jgi:hypothetical protein
MGKCDILLTHFRQEILLIFVFDNYAESFSLSYRVFKHTAT